MFTQQNTLKHALGDGGGVHAVSCKRNILFSLWVLNCQRQQQSQRPRAVHPVCVCVVQQITAIFSARRIRAADTRNSYSF